MWRLASTVALVSPLLVFTLTLAEPVAAADAAAAAEGALAELDERDARLYRRLSQPRGGYARLLFTSGFGRGLRFNNPFRLETQLGDGGESLSLTAPYFDLGLGLTGGDPDGLQHGAMLHLSLAIEGVAQQSLSASYLLLYRSDSPLMLYGRGGPVLLTAPDANLGGELAQGANGFFTAGFGVSAELVGSLFYGAGSYEREFTAFPILSLQLGVIADLEVLP
jgi:hypothetical protein